MKTPASLTALLACLSLLCCAPLAAKSPASLEARLAAQNALFDEYYETELKTHPEMATAYGDYRYNDQLNDYSLAGEDSENGRDVAYLARLKAIPVIGFAEQDRLSHDVLARSLEQRIANHDFKEYEMPLNQMSGPQTRLADLPLAVPLDSVKHYEDYIARLHQIPRVFTQTKEVLRAGKQDGLMPVRFLLEKVPAQCLGVVAVDPFLLPAKKFPGSISLEEQARLRQEITATVVKEVLPAYVDFASFVTTEYAPSGRTTLAVNSLPGGEQRYLNDIRSRTTISNLTPDQIHQIGLTEIKRIEAEMLEIAHREGFSDLASFRESVRNNPRYHPASAEAIVQDFRKYLAQMQPKLPELFGFIPGLPVTVEPMPDFEPGTATHYQSGTPDGKRPGRVVVAVSNFEQRSMVDDEATAYHEGIPGHHMQLSVAQTLTDLPRFRRHGGNSGYIEGWALYAERLGKEVGFYQDPVSDYGRLSSELFRAVRLVVDTGIHSKGWSRDQVVEFFRNSGAVDEPTIQSETDRYIAWPAQALAYKLGQLKILELRERARKALGREFDIKSFNDEMLNGGVLPLDLLDARTNDWIHAQQHHAGSGAAK
ncbi:MAG TPA: DUF885 domain-containing protein [Steroidobacteraceae bacterium]|jgi:uncharacterized protein (DUF885 family)|nr:DUF885 domain-containing protein [Steroidobacteraceae bacterium]